MKKTATIINPMLMFHGPGMYSLMGMVKDHAKQGEFKGPLQRTSRVLRIDFEKGEAETLNTIYTMEFANAEELLEYAKAIKPQSETTH